jgi:lysophospholipase L1-like esterase
LRSALSIAVLCAACRCSSGSDETGADVPGATALADTDATQSGRVDPDDPRIRYTGLFDTRSPKAVRFAWPGTHFEVAFKGASLRVRLTDTPVEDETRETDWLTVVIDGGKPKTFALAEGEHVYPVASGLAAGAHRALIWKRTEAEVGTVTFHGMQLDDGATLLPLPPVSRRMLVVGDSLSAGNGNEGRDSSCRWSAAKENNYETYGAHAARALGAEYVAAAWSGKGLIRNYDKRDRLTMPELYDRVIPTEPDSPRAMHSPADVVVVNLGTNDFFPGIPEEATFISAYQELLDELRAQHPGALLVLGLGPMLSDDYPHPRSRSILRGWLTTIQKQRRESGDSRVELIELWTDRAEGVGCDFHPNLKTHARLGQELAARVRKRLHW